MTVKYVKRGQIPLSIRIHVYLHHESAKDAKFFFGFKLRDVFVPYRKSIFGWN